jgi:hypothetical protein
MLPVPEGFIKAQQRNPNQISRDPRPVPEECETGITRSPLGTGLTDLQLQIGESRDSQLRIYASEVWRLAHRNDG